MAAALRISQAYRMTAPAVLPRDKRAYAAALRQWGDTEAKRVALAVVWGRYTEEAAHQELAAHLARQAELSGIKVISCRELAESMLCDELDALDARFVEVRNQMIVAAERSLRENPREPLAAALIAAAIAEAANVPPDLIDSAFKIASWRTRRRA